MLHKDCSMHLLQFLHVLHDATKNQQHLRELFHDTICFFFMNKWCSKVFPSRTISPNSTFGDNIFLRWFPTNPFQAREKNLVGSWYPTNQNRRWIWKTGFKPSPEEPLHKFYNLQNWHQRFSSKKKVPRNTGFSIA
jgi:hypothetical protein